MQINSLIKKQQAMWHDIFINKKHFQVGDWALLDDSKSKDFKGKFTTHWLGPYEIESVYENGLVKIKTIDDLWTYFFVNGHRLNMYHHLKSKEELLMDMLQ